MSDTEDTNSGDAEAAADDVVEEAASTEATVAEAPAPEAGEAQEAPAEEAAAAEPAANATPSAAPEAVEEDDAGRPDRKVREGRVVSNGMEKTAVVLVTDRVRHPRYNKTVQRSKKLHVHDETDTLELGDIVRVMETRPLSKTKHWRLVEVIERAR